MYLYKVEDWPQCMRLQLLGNATTHARMYSRQVSMDISMDFGRLLGSRGAWDSPAREELLSPSDHCKINPLAPPMQSNGIGGGLVCGDPWRPVPMQVATPATVQTIQGRHNNLGPWRAPHWHSYCLGSSQRGRRYNS